jgi:Zn-dependent membrane protease YugP
VEFNASSRAKRLLTEYGIVAPDESHAISAVLNATAMTYVAAAVTAILQLLYWLLRLGLIGGDD